MFHVSVAEAKILIQLMDEGLRYLLFTGARGTVQAGSGRFGTSRGGRQSPRGKVFPSQLSSARSAGFAEQLVSVHPGRLII